MKYELNKLNEPIIKEFNDKLSYDMCLSGDNNRYSWFRITADDKTIILSEMEMKGIIEYYNSIIQNKNILINGVTTSKCDIIISGKLLTGVISIAYKKTDTKSHIYGCEENGAGKDTYYGYGQYSYTGELVVESIEDYKKNYMEETQPHLIVVTTPYFIDYLYNVQFLEEYKVGKNPFIMSGIQREINKNEF